MQNTGLDMLQAEIKISRININNHIWYKYDTNDTNNTYDTNLLTESKEELKGLLMRVKEESGEKLA